MASSKEIANKAREAVRVQREMLAKQRLDAEKATKALEEQKSRIPTVTQRSLRGGNLSGLSGLRKRVAYSEAKKNIEQKQGNIGILIKELARYESEELNPYEKEIDAYERAVKKQESTWISTRKPVSTTKAVTSSTASRVVSPSTTFKVSTPTKITLPSSVLNSNKSSNITTKKSLFSWRK